MWGDPIYVPSHLKKDELNEYGKALQCVLNELTEHADLAIQQPASAAYFFQNMKKKSSSSIK